MTAPVLAWHFVGNTLRDGRPVPPDGEWLVHDGRVEMCHSGLHASRHPFDALQYAPGSILCWVECDDVVSEDGDKLVCRRRRIVARRDMTDALRALLGGVPTSPAFDASSTSARRRQSQAGDGFVLHLGRRVATWFGLAKGGA